VSLRAALSEAAAEEDVSLQSLMLDALYGHYGLERPRRRRGRRYMSWLDQGSERMVIRAERGLFEKIKRDAEASGRSMRRVFLDILTDHFQVSLGT
jgi:hypothetical protein